MSNGYVDAFDPRKSGRVSMQTFQPHFQSSSTSLPADLVLSLALSKCLLALSLHIARDWLLAQGVSAWNLTALVLVAGSIGLCAWERVWEKPRGLGKRKEEPLSRLYPIVLTFEVLTALLALTRLSVLKFVMLSSFSTLWARGIPIAFLSSSGGKKAVGKSNAVFMICVMLAGSYLLDSAVSSPNPPRAGYLLILAHLLLCGQRMDMLAAQTPETRGRAHALGSLRSVVVAPLVSLAHWFLASPDSAAPIPTTANPTFKSFSAPDASITLVLPAACLVALSMIVVDPLLSRALLAHFPAARQISAGWPISVAGTIFVGLGGFGHAVDVPEALVGAVAWFGISHLVSSDPRSALAYSSSSDGVATAVVNEPFLSRLSTFYRHLRATIKTILATPDSRRIYFFLCLNLAFMFVQMAYGIWTNSLGLISDSIHMFFDCLALAMGLFASVMATWEPNSKFTYGYSRVETLSGFANGLFLCLISIFIVFEAIQRLLDPPEMNTGQLLIVSSLGLAVNLVGMFATGHHHGHSHGGGGGHSHGHSHAPPPKPKKITSSHDSCGHNGHAVDSPSHANAHGHSHDSGHSHGDTHDADSDDEDDGAAAAHGGSHNMKGVFLHVMADTLGSVGVIISTLLIERFGWTGFDPLASIFIAVLIFASVVPLVADSGRLLILDMGEEREAQVKQALLAVSRIEGVASYSRARFWAKDPSSMVGSIAIQLAPSPAAHDPSRGPDARVDRAHYASIDKVTARVRRALRGAIGGLDDLVIEVQPTEGIHTGE